MDLTSGITPDPLTSTVFAILASLLLLSTFCSTSQTKWISSFIRELSGYMHALWRPPLSTSTVIPRPSWAFTMVSATKVDEVGKNAINFVH